MNHLEHAVSSIEEVEAIVSRVNQGKDMTIYKVIMGHELIIPIHLTKKTKMEIPRADSWVVQLRLDYDQYRHTKWHAFYLSGSDFRVFTNYWHAYACSLSMVRK